MTYRTFCRAARGLPFENVDTLDGLRVGKSGYIIPWAARWKDEKVVCIPGDTLYSLRPFGTQDLKVTRVSLTKFDVDASTTRFFD